MSSFEKLTYKKIVPIDYRKKNRFFFSAPKTLTWSENSNKNKNKDTETSKESIWIMGIVFFSLLIILCCIQLFCSLT